MEIDIRIYIKKKIHKEMAHATTEDSKSDLQGGLAGWSPKWLVFQPKGHQAGRASVAGGV